MRSEQTRQRPSRWRTTDLARSGASRPAAKAASRSALGCSAAGWTAGAPSALFLSSSGIVSVSVNLCCVGFCIK